jgi:hypothetical protein
LGIGKTSSLTDIPMWSSIRKSAIIIIFLIIWISYGWNGDTAGQLHLSADGKETTVRQ